MGQAVLHKPLLFYKGHFKECEPKNVILVDISQSKGLLRVLDFLYVCSTYVGHIGQICLIAHSITVLRIV